MGVRLASAPSMKKLFVSIVGAVAAVVLTRARKQRKNAERVHANHPEMEAGDTALAPA